MYLNYEPVTPNIEKESIVGKSIHCVTSLRDQDQDKFALNFGSK